MRTLKCSRCGKEVPVSDNWKFKRCQKCHEKDVLYNARKKEIRRLDRDNSLSETLRAKYPQTRTFREFSVWFQRVWHRKPSFDEYLRFKEDISAKESKEKAHIETVNTRRQMNLDKLVNEVRFPLVGEDCRAYRAARMKTQRSFSESAFMGHTYKCKVCTAWLDWYKFESEPEQAKEGDMSAFDKPISGANLYGSSDNKEEETSPYRTKPLDRDLNRTEFNDDNSDFRKVKRKNGD